MQPFKAIALAIALSSEAQAFQPGLSAGLHSNQQVASFSRSSAQVALPSIQMHGRRSALAKIATGATAVGGAALFSAANIQSAQAEAVSPWPYSEFSRAVDEDRVEAVQFSADGSSILAVDADGVRHSVQVLPGAATDLIQRLDKHNVRYAVQPSGQNQGGAASAAGGVLSTLAGPALILGGLYLLSRNQQGGGGGMPGGPGGIGKAQSKMELEPNTGVTFDDVAGCDQSKLELNEIVNFLKNPAKYSALGAKIPRGVVMEGPPGTGKTLLARAVAGEAGVPFMSASGSEFVEMFVGVGASRVRDMFKQAKENAPCIVFIDEIDAIGKQRAGGGGGMGGGNDEREQTLNQILTEMDGFEGNSGVIVIAATNRADILDAALLRPGRFDRRVPVDLPDKNGRRDILQVHIKGKPLASDVDIELIAKRTIGFSGASLANLMNEAAIVAARRDKTEIGYDEVDYALDRLTVGMQKKTETLSPVTQRLVAVHEGGHAILGALTPGYDTVGKITIIPRSNGAGGFTLFVPDQARMDSGMYSKTYLQNQLAVALGGRVAEEIVYGIDEVTTGASSDLQQVRDIARRMVTQWGFAGGELGFMALEPAQQQGMMPEKNSPQTELAIEAEVKKLVTAAYIECKRILVENRVLLDELTEELLEKETIGTEELNVLVGKYAISAAAESMAPATV